MQPYHMMITCQAKGHGKKKGAIGVVHLGTFFEGGVTSGAEHLYKSGLLGDSALHVCQYTRVISAVDLQAIADIHLDRYPLVIKLPLKQLAFLTCSWTADKVSIVNVEFV